LLVCPRRLRARPLTLKPTGEDLRKGPAAFFWERPWAHG
jgi:hypothetical protein